MPQSAPHGGLRCAPKPVTPRQGWEPRPDSREWIQSSTSTSRCKKTLGFRSIWLLAPGFEAFFGFYWAHKLCKRARRVKDQSHVAFSHVTRNGMHLPTFGMLIQQPALRFLD